MPHDLSERVFIVTGAGSGIGAATARLLHHLNARVALVGWTAQKLDDLANDLGSDDRLLVLSLDVADPDSAQSTVNQVLAKFGRMDGAFNCAGVFGKFGDITDDTLDNFQKVVSINLQGIWSAMKAQIPALVANQGGTIVNCSSVAGHQGHAQSPIYSATKHAVIGLSKSVALQYADCGVRVNVLSPGSTDTPILRSLYSDTATLEARAKRAPMGRIGEPSEIAEAAIWLLSERSSYVNGQTLIVDGGVLAGTAKPQPI